jgi:hypothetical protein
MKESTATLRLMAKYTLGDPRVSTEAVAQVFKPRSAKQAR